MDKRIDVISSMISKDIISDSLNDIAITLLGLMIVLVRLYDVYTVYDDVS